MFMALWIIVVLVAVAAVAGSTIGQGRSPTDGGALRILDERLARGELSPAEHAERRTVLVAQGTAQSTPRRLAPWAVLGIAGAAVLLVVAVAVAWTGAGWNGASSGWGWMGASSISDHMGGRGITTTSAQPFADAREVPVDAGDLWFEPDEIEVTAGEEVNLRVSNTGQVFHDLTVPAADLMVDVESGDEAVGGLVLDEVGTYEFFCSVPGHADAGMRGTIVVSA